jgi:hypothetical protein
LFREVDVTIRMSKPLFAGVLIVLLAVAAWAQDESEQQTQMPAQSLSVVPISGAPVNVVVPDTNPLSGAITPGIGSWGAKHSFYMPGFYVAQALDSDPALAGLQGTNTRGYANLAADLQFVHFWNSNAELRYTGSVRYISDAAPQASEHFTDTQNVAITKQFQTARTRIVLGDQVDYTLYSNFAGSGMEGLGDITTQVSSMTGIWGVQMPSITLQQQYLPTQGILTERTSRVSNVVVGEADYRLASRSTLTFTGGFGLLHFPTTDLIDSNQALGTVGYNYQPTPRDTIAVEYDYEAFMFPGASASIHDQFGQVKYSRRLTGRFTVSGGIGPQFLVVDIPAVQQTAAVNQNTASWQAQGNVTYRDRSLLISAVASRLAGGGSGVLFGAETDNFQGNITYGVSKNYSASLACGVSHSHDLQTGQSISFQFANVTLNRRAGRYGNIFANYYFEHQSENLTCIGIVNCAPSGTRQIGSIGFNWTYHPVPVNF